MKGIKFNYLIISCLYINLPIKDIAARQHDSVIIRVHYDLRHMRDTSAHEKFYPERMLLMLWRDSSTFLSYDKIYNRMVVQTESDRQIRSSMEEIPVIQLPSVRTVVPQELTNIYGTGTYHVYDFIGRYYHYTDKPKDIAWTILEDSTKNVLGFTCTKAKGDQMGRTWEVWFCTDISVPAGPWYLGGLPGLILEAVDSRKEVSYTASAVHQGGMKDEVLDSPYAFAPPNTEGAIRTTKADFLKLMNRVMQDPEVYRETLRNQIRFSQDYGVSNHYSWTWPVNNPVDLEGVKIIKRN